MPCSTPPSRWHRGLAEGRAQHQHAGDRRDAGLLLADDLRQKGPERDRHRIDVPRRRAEIDLLFRRDGFDALGGQDVLKRQARSAGEGVEDRLEGGGRATGCIGWHEEAFLDPGATGAKEGLADRSILAGRKASNQREKGTSKAESAKTRRKGDGEDARLPYQDTIADEIDINYLKGWSYAGAGGMEVPFGPDTNGTSIHKALTAQGNANTDRFGGLYVLRSPWTSYVRS